MDRKINVFVGGSSEALKIAKKVCSMLTDLGNFNCTIWSKDTFGFNESFLESLIKACYIHDFGIFVATNDDIAIIRKNVNEIPRDNVIFEYGLFLGAMSNRRTFLLQEDKCKLPTDLLGYTTPKFKLDYDDGKWNELIKSMSEDMYKQINTNEVQALPSTSLAIGYFNSFLSRVSEHISKKEGSVLIQSKLEHKEVVIKVYIPHELSNNIGSDAFMFYKKMRYETDEIGDDGRPFPIKYYKNESDAKLMIVDIPTTLNAIRPSINLLLNNSGLGIDQDKIKIERKELENFKGTLSYLISQDAYAKDIVEVEWMPNNN